MNVRGSQKDVKNFLDILIVYKDDVFIGGQTKKNAEMVTISSAGGPFSQNKEIMLFPLRWGKEAFRLEMAHHHLCTITMMCSKFKTKDFQIEFWNTIHL